MAPERPGKESSLGRLAVSGTSGGEADATADTNAARAASCLLLRNNKKQSTKKGTKDVSTLGQPSDGIKDASLAEGSRHG
jgi:hypothetical protein